MVPTDTWKGVSMGLGAQASDSHIRDDSLNRARLRGKNVTRVLWWWNALEQKRTLRCSFVYPIPPPPPPARPLSLGVRPGGRGLDLVLSSSEKARKGLAAKSDQPRSSMTEKVTASKGAIGSNPKSLKSQKLHRPAERTTSKRWLDGSVSRAKAS